MINDGPLRSPPPTPLHLTAFPAVFPAGAQIEGIDGRQSPLFECFIFTVPDSLREILTLQKAGIPIKKSYANDEFLYASFEAGFDRFWTNSNYQCVLAGVGYLPENYLPLLDHRRDIIDQAEHIFHDIQKRSAALVSTLPTQHDYLQSVYASIVN